MLEHQLLVLLELKAAPLEVGLHLLETHSAIASDTRGKANPGADSGLAPFLWVMIPCVKGHGETRYRVGMGPLHSRT